MRWIGFAIAIALMFGGFAQPALAQTGGTTANAPVELPFIPPLGRALRFRVTKTTYKDGKPVFPTPLAIVQEFRFERDGDGFLLYWRIAPDGLPPIFSDPIHGRAMKVIMAPYMGEPTVFELDEDGYPLRVRDWEGTKRRIEDSLKPVGEVAAAAGKDREAMTRAIDFTIRQFSALSAEDAAPFLLRDVIILLSWGGFSMSVGEKREESSPAKIPLFGVSVTVHDTLSLVSADARTITVLNTRVVDQEELRKLTDALLARVGHTQKQQATEAGEAAGAALTTRAQIDIATGLPIVVDSTVGLLGAERPRSSIRIEWLK